MPSQAQAGLGTRSTQPNVADRLAATGLVKSFRSRKVVKGVSLDVRAGEVVGLLGPNGAGKRRFSI